jgi:hypothetical protein
VKVRTAIFVVVVAVIAVLGLGVLYVIVAGDGADSSDSPRFRASAALLTLSQNKAEVERFAKEHGRLDSSGRALSVIAPSSYLRKVVVSNDGSMSGVDVRGEFVVLLEPRPDQGAVHWQCFVVPAKFSPSPCRDK